MDAKFVQESYDKHHILSSCADIVLEAKRVILNEDLEKIANLALSHTNEPKLFSQIQHECQNNIDWNECLPENWSQNNYETDQSISSLEVTDNEIQKTPTEENKPHTILQNTVFEKRLIKKYFNRWKSSTENLNNKKIHEEKLDKFIEALKNVKNEEHINKDEKHKKYSEKARSSYKNRFMVQKNIINKQKSKLEEQNKIIEELKLGIIREDILKSIENTKTSIREIFAGCSEKIKCKLPTILIEEHNFNVNIQKAPKIIQKMEARALQRAKNRKVILERKRVMEELRQKMLEEAIEKKKVLEEEERKKHLEIMKEQRKKELEIERIRNEKRKVFEEKWSVAVNFHEKLLKQQCLQKLYNNLILSRENRVRAIEHHKNKVLRKCLNIWMDLVESLYVVKYEIADAHFSYKVLKKCIKTWNEARIESIQNMQVAEDIYDFRLTSNVFMHWQRYVFKQILLESNKMKIAEKHYKRRLLFHCFYQWRSLKAVLELEKAKELKKQKWREKVWEILPDFRPPEDF